MSNKPMLFSTPMVQAILAGDKTTTRRIIKPQPEYGPLSYFYAGSRRYVGKWGYPSDHTNGKNALWTPPCHGDDLLWVRETWMKWREHYLYKTDDTLADCVREDGEAIKWHPSIHMPKAAARIFLHVSKVSVERLQDISEVEAIDEGMLCYHDWQTPEYKEALEMAERNRTLPPLGFTPRQRFAHFWDSLCKPKEKHLYGWEANPWVWRVAFQRVEKPENWPDKGG